MMKLIFSTLVLFSMNVIAANDPETIVFSFQKQKNPDELRKAIEQLKPVLEKEIGKKVEVIVPTSYGVSAQGLISGKVHVSYMDSLPYILASKEAELEILAVEKRNGRTEYDSLIVVHKDSPIKKLADAKGKKMAFTSQTSTSGFLFPVGELVKGKYVKNADNVNSFFSQSVYAGGYDKALAAVANGQADIGAFSDYVLEGTKADLYGTPEIREKVRVLTRISGVPTHLIAAVKSLSPELRAKIQAALLKISQENSQLLSSVYGAAEIVKPAQKNHVEKTMVALKSAGLEANSFVK